MKLRKIAHSRAGDKGDISNISVIAFDERDYPFLQRHLTVDRVKEQFGTLVRGPVTRYELPALGALNFVLEKALAGGVTRSVAIDRHGKSFSAVMLDIDMPVQPSDASEHETVSAAHAAGAPARRP